jgi:hypothetical protein
VVEQVFSMHEALISSSAAKKKKKKEKDRPLTHTTHTWDLPALTQGQPLIFRDYKSSGSLSSLGPHPHSFSIPVIQWK